LTASKNAIELTRLAAKVAADKLAENLVALDVSQLMPLCDVFLLVSGRSERQVAAIADGLEEKLAEAGSKVLRSEGKSLARWILLDFGYVIVHVMHEEDRMHYSLERIWNDCPLIELPPTSPAEV
jgi:ribosome-associated protein